MYIDAISRTTTILRIIIDIIRENAIIKNVQLKPEKAEWNTKMKEKGASDRKQ